MGHTLLLYIRNVLVGLDQFVNSILGGDPAETISYRAAMARKRGSKVGCIVCQVLDFIVTDHCNNTVKAHSKESPYDSITPK